MLRKTTFLCSFFVLLLQAHWGNAQMLSGTQLNLTNTYPNPRGGTSLMANWTFQYNNNTELHLKYNYGTPSVMKITTAGIYAERYLYATQGINSLHLITNKIGVNTTTPVEKLHITGGYAKADGFVVDGYSTSQSSWGGVWNGVSLGTGSFSLDNQTNLSPVLLQGQGGVALRTTSGRLTMDKDGIVTIGLDDAAITSISTNTDATHEYSLYVAKGIRSESSKVDLKGDWPDFVFEPSYQLTPLDELELFINTHHHLPNIPSAAEIKDKGIDLGDMNAKLLQKVEELTLYVIELQKEIQLLENRIKED